MSTSTSTRTGSSAFTLVWVERQWPRSNRPDMIRSSTPVRALAGLVAPSLRIGACANGAPSSGPKAVRLAYFPNFTHAIGLVGVKRRRIQRALGEGNGASGIALYSQVILPAALPAILAWLKQGWAFAWRSLMAGEPIDLIDCYRKRYAPARRTPGRGISLSEQTMLAFRGNLPACPTKGVQ